MTWKRPSEMQLNSIFYPGLESLVTLSHTNENMKDPLYVITSLLNNMPLSEEANSSNACAVLGTLPMDILSRSLENLPAPVRDCLRERVFVAAVTAENELLVSTMLQLNVDPYEKTLIDQELRPSPICPLEYAVAAGDFLVAKTLLVHMCKSTARSTPDELLEHVTTQKRIQKPLFFDKGLRPEEGRELICILLEAGARPTRQCLRWMNSLDSLKQLLEARPSILLSWLRVGLLAHLSNSKMQGWAAAATKYIFKDPGNDLVTDHPHLRSELLQLIYAGGQSQHRLADDEVLLEVFYSFGYTFSGEPHPVATCGLINRACKEQNWKSAAIIMQAVYPQTYFGTFHGRGGKDNEQERIQQQFQLQLENRIAIRDSIKEKNAISAYRYLKKSVDPNVWDEFAVSIIELETSCGACQSSIEIIQEMEARHYRTELPFVTFMTHGQTAGIVALLQRSPKWFQALETARKNQDFTALELLIFRTSTTPYIPGGLKAEVREQYCYRVLALYAIGEDDYNLCRWLFQLGMNADEFWYSDTLFFPTPCTGSISLNRLGRDYPRNETFKVLPSLLAIAVQRNLLPWIRFLLDNGVRAADSMALLRSVKSKANVSVIQLLLNVAQSRGYLAQGNYGSAALRQAVLDHDPEMVGILCKSVDRDAIEFSTEEAVAKDTRKATSPLGQATIMKDFRMVETLLRCGASPNAYVSTHRLELREQYKSSIQRMTPLLAAIDSQSPTITKMLVENGAEISYKRQLGIFRTPL